MPAEGRDFATLAGHFPDLPHDAVLIFEEQRGPLAAKKTTPIAPGAGRAPDASATFNAASEPLTDPLTGAQSQYRVDAEDALPFPFCLSGFTDEGTVRNTATTGIAPEHRPRRPRADDLGRVVRRSSAPQILLPPRPEQTVAPSAAPVRASTFPAVVNAQPLTQSLLSTRRFRLRQPAGRP